MGTDDYIEHLKREKRRAEGLLAESFVYLSRLDPDQADLQNRIAEFFGTISRFTARDEAEEREACRRYYRPESEEGSD